MTNCKTSSGLIAYGARPFWPHSDQRFRENRLVLLDVPCELELKL